MTIEELIERLEKAEGGSRDLDGAIEVEARRQVAYSLGLSDETRAKWEHSGGTVYDPDTIYDAPAYTASIDAAVALAEKVLPGWTIASIGQDDRKGWHAELRKGYLTSYSTVALAGASNGALALCTAVLRALQERRP